MKKFKTFKTILGRYIKISKNKRKKTFTIRTESGNYRTIKMTKEEFNNCQFNSGNDWANFLKTESGNYYSI